jgi:hypothetical protein
MYRRNVLIPRAWGLRLAHELALLRISDLFMGTSSGFATFVSFTDVAYAIVNVEHSFARYAEVQLDDRHYPFAKANQVLTWHPETAEELLSLFDELYPRIRTNAVTTADRAAPAFERGSVARSTGTDAA